MRHKKAMILSFDQGLEHNPSQFNLHTIDPEYVLNIALEGGYTGIVMHAGLAEKYYLKAFTDIPLIIKLNGRSELSPINPVSRQLCSVQRAVRIGADAVGYTIYDGSPAEPEMFTEFSMIVEEAHSYGLPVIAWMYPRGDGINEEDSDTIAYAARIGLELGADFIKVKYNNDPAGFDWVVRCAGRAPVIVADSYFANDIEILKHVYDVMKANARGVAYGRTIWTHPRPFAITKAIHDIIFGNKTPQEAIQRLNH